MSSQPQVASPKSPNGVHQSTPKVQTPKNDADQQKAATHSASRSGSRRSSAKMEKATATTEKRNRDEEDPESILDSSKDRNLDETTTSSSIVAEQKPAEPITLLNVGAESKPASPLAEPVVVVAEDVPEPQDDDAVPEPAATTTPVPPQEQSNVDPVALPSNNSGAPAEDAVHTRDSKPSSPVQLQPVCDVDHQEKNECGEEEKNTTIEKPATTIGTEESPMKHGDTTIDAAETDAVPVPAVRHTAAFDGDIQKSEETESTADAPTAAEPSPTKKDDTTVGEEAETATVAQEPSTPKKMDDVLPAPAAAPAAGDTTTTTTTTTIQKITSVTATPLAIKKSQSPVQEGLPAEQPQMTTTLQQTTITVTSTSTNVPASPVVNPQPLKEVDTNQVTSPNLRKASRSASIPPVTGAVEPIPHVSA